MTDGPWRVGNHYRIHVYEGDRPVATFHREEDAARAVEAIGIFDRDPLVRKMGELSTAIIRIRRIHRRWREPDSGREICVECKVPWPCRTVHLIEATK